MTTIAARNGIIAADSRETDQHEKLETTYVVKDTCKKLFRLKDGSVLGCAGSSESGRRLIDAMKKGHALPKLDDMSAIHVRSDGMWLYEGSIWVHLKDPFYAIGSGAGFATAAMRAGADAVTAAKIGSEMDIYSGGRVRWLKVK
jgi:ATP-dependent protease HslVU (ClpYQ) peptidase subunit